MEQRFQDMSQKVIYDNNSEYFAAHFDKRLTQKPIPPKYYKIMSFKILSTVNPIVSMKPRIHYLVHSA